MSGNELYITYEELLKLEGFSSSSTGMIQAQGIDTMYLDDIQVIIANAKGVQALDREAINKLPLTGWVCRFPASMHPPHGLKLVRTDDHHFTIAPTRNMSLRKFETLVKELTVSAITIFKKQGRAV
ncbi:hypothetical protein MO867_10650 [Microbulbifer sp. OS29]|uniref:Tse2 ADP-ribosyltransferase toxin domain-containing protein n=1 Tax=Microbulbifer okhotskensis TaxID=2926617 RepID=A0A9X2J5V6_9GAMM|nr:hypothetical protein [Microbulbifer okhotskensis]MCO1334799.1 hypothetical protein [Microbulbifer okhotskensis]